jgi:excisionase family DNA binding protein
VTERERELVTRLEAALAPEVVTALLALVDERLAAVTVPNDGSPWFSLDEAAAYLRVSERTLERLIARGKLPSTTLGRRRLVHRDHLDELGRATTGEETAPTAPPRRR